MPLKETALADTGQYLTFKIGDEVFALEVSQVREVLDMSRITRVPRAPDFMRGVINVRGSVVPVVDLRLKFALESIPYTERTCIIVVEIDSEAGNTVLIGIVVDAVSEVLNIREEEIENTPTFGTKLNTDYILGMAKMEGGVKILLNIDQVLSTEEIARLESVS